jgi:competence protein ComFC
LIKSLINLLASKKCITCPSINQDANQLCFSCWNELSFISNSDPQRSISIANYGKTAKKIIVNLKYNDTHLYADIIGKFIEFYLKHHQINYDYIIPIPLSKKKLFLRRFNQTILIAKYLCKTQPRKLLFNFLLKKFHTLSQASLDYQQRTKNLKNSFILNNKHKIKLDNKVILLLDDVTTTNSTLDEAHLLLDKLPVKKIILVTFTKSFT